MATTGRLSRVFYPRWIVSSREVNSVATVEDISELRPPVRMASPSPSRGAEEQPSQRVNRLKELIASRVVKAGRQMLSSQSPSRKVIEQNHSVSSGQCFVEAMTECHSSVNQYYGLSPPLAAKTQPETSLVSQSAATSDKRSASIASKQARINDFKQNRLSRSETQQRMKSLTVNALAPGISVVSRMTRLRELCDHAKNHPSSRVVAINRGVVPFLLSLQAENERLKGRGLADSKKLCGIINESLSVLGHSNRINTRGIRILSIDGGGTRGLVAIETLKQLEILCNAPIHTLFDYICGVSTGGLLAVLVGAMKLPLDRCEAVYKECSQRIFSRGKLAGAANLITRHCFYDMSVWEGILQDELGAERTMLSTARDKNSPSIGLLSTVMADVPYNHVFRNYNHDINAPSQYPGTCNARVWEAIRASSAAPGYFEDFRLGRHIHQDGGVLNNNPTAVAIHEAKALWPDEEVQCVVSVGNGRYEPTSADNVQDVTSLRHKVGTFIHSATNTEDVHTVLNDLLRADTYYRFNPYMSEEFLLDEIQEGKLQQMQYETQLYLRRNASKMNKAGQQLKRARTTQQKAHDWLSSRYSTLLNQRKSVN